MKHYVKTELITPKKANDFLEKNINNRPISKMEVNRWIEVIHRGNWIMEAGTISFDTDGNLIDGQHRLTAISKSSVGVKANVQYGCTPESKYAIDTGRPRFRSQVLTMMDVKHAKLISSAICEVILYERTGLIGDNKIKIENLDMRNRHDQDPENWQRAVSVSRKSHGLLTSHVSPSTLVTMAYLFNRQDLTKSLQFFRQLSDDEAACQTIRKLRQRLMNLSSRHNQRAMWYFTLAWDSFTNEPELKVFPKPEKLRQHPRLVALLHAGYPLGHYTNATANNNERINK